MNRRPMLTVISLWLAALLGFGGMVALAAIAAAIPPGGPSPNTPGTKSSLNPTSLAAGERITFKVSGFPGGETLYIKIDDGKACGDTSQGGCVYHTQKIAKNGTVSGALTLPGDIKPGKHWLRFLASEPVLKPDGSIKGIKGYTLRSPDFTIAAKNNSNQNTSNQNPSAQNTQQPGESAETATDPGASGDDATTEGQSSLKVTGSSGNSTGDDTDNTVTGDPTPVAQAAPATPQVVVAPSESEFPVIGTISLGVAIALCAAALGFVVARR